MIHQREATNNLRRSHRRKKFFKRDDLTAFLLLLLPMLWWGVFFFFAFARAIYFSFTNLTVDVTRISEFTFNQYIRLFHDEYFFGAIKNTLIWTIVMTVANNGVGLLVAFLISKLKHGQKTFLTLLFWPTLVSAVISSDITKLIFNPSDTGIMNQIIMYFGGSPLAWYNDPSLSLFTIMIIPALLGFSSQMLIYYVAIEGVSRPMVEAAIMDGASSWTIFRKIYTPSISNAVMYNCILSIISGIKIIGPMQLITNGGPTNSSMSLVLYLYNNMIGGENGYASAIGVVILDIIIILSAIQLFAKKAIDRKEALAK